MCRKDEFVGRLAKEAVMARRNEACRVNPTNVGFPSEVSLSSARLFDHLTSKIQRVYSGTKQAMATNIVGRKTRVCICKKTGILVQ